MYERLLDRTLSPTFEDLLTYSGKTDALWTDVNNHIQEAFSADRQIRFPYGNKYGWSCKYSQKRKHICDIFAENGAFALHFRISDKQLLTVYDGLSGYSKSICDNKYPCSGGGWLTYRVLTREHTEDVKRLLDAKMNLK